MRGYGFIYLWAVT